MKIINPHTKTAVTMRTQSPRRLFVVASVLYLLLWGCNNKSSSPPSPPPPPPSNVSVEVTPSSTTVQVNGNEQFTATVTGTTNTAVTWRVNGVVGGDPTAGTGTITTAGLYTAPAMVPNPPNVSVSAVSQADTSKSDTASVLIVGAGVGDVNQARQTPPIKLGTSGGNENDRVTSGNTIKCCSGTLGALVERGGIKYILSNNHVISRRDQATPGEDILQPGLADTNCTANGTIVARLSQFAPLRPPAGTSFSNVDAAIAEVVSGMVDETGAILLFGSASGNTIDPAPPASSPAQAALGMLVAKSGRTTGLTCSTIQSIRVNVVVEYQEECGSGTKFNITFTNQVVVGGAGFSGDGDSGSLIVSAQTAQPVALLYGGDATSTVANPIQDVLQALKDPNPPNTLPSVVGGPQHPIACPSSPTTTLAQAATLSEARLAVATAAKNKFADQLMADPAVMGVGVGASHDHPGEPAVLIYVEKGKPHPAIPAELDGVRTKVIFTDRFRARTTERQKAEARLSLSEEEVARALAVKEKHVVRLMADPAMIGVGVGASQDSPGEAAVVLYIEKGRAAGVFPVQIDGVRTRVIRTDRFRAFGWNETTTSVCRPKL